MVADETRQHVDPDRELFPGDRPFVAPRPKGPFGQQPNDTSLFVNEDQSQQCFLSRRICATASSRKGLGNTLSVRDA